MKRGRRPLLWTKRLSRTVQAAIAATALSLALAHATVVFGTLGVAPNPPPVDEPFLIELTLADPTGTPVEDAIVRAELTLVESTSARGSRPQGEAFAPSGSEPAAETRFSEVEPGRYRAEAEVSVAGSYEILLRDQTFREEEATQIISLPIGTQEAVARVEFLFPPTATGGGLSTWLLWLVALPLIAGIVVTVLVLRGGPAAAPGSPGDRENERE